MIDRRPLLLVALLLTAGEARSRAADDGLQVAGELGQLDPVAVEAAFRTRSPDIERCYRAVAGQVWYLSGRLGVAVRIGHGGRVLRSRVVTPLGNRAVESCALKALAGLPFPPPKGGLEAEATFSWEFDSHAQLLRWEQAEVGAGIEAQRQQLDACGAPPRGLRVALFVGPGGRVGSAGVGADEPVAAEYAACIEARLLALRFADPRGRMARAAYAFSEPGPRIAAGAVRPAVVERRAPRALSVARAGGGKIRELAHARRRRSERSR